MADTYFETYNQSTTWRTNDERMQRQSKKRKIVQNEKLEIINDPSQLRAYLEECTKETENLLELLANKQESQQLQEQAKYTMQIFLPESLAQKHKEILQREWMEAKKPEVVWHKPLAVPKDAHLEKINWEYTLQYFKNMEERKQPFEFPFLETKEKNNTMGVFVKNGWHIKARTVIGPYASVVSFDSEYVERSDTATLLTKEFYIHHFEVSESNWGEMYDSENKKLCDLVGDAYSCGNILKFISDCRKDPVKEPYWDKDKDRLPNVARTEVLDKGWPFVFVVAIKDLKGGDELLIQHKDSFWKNYTDAIVPRLNFRDKLQLRYRKMLQELKRVSDSLPPE
eukprot:m.177577 g.177577  ORF g.177577 m.177577 type:complete len:340 (+) comp15454_c0_seq11:19-1038(+)